MAALRLDALIDRLMRFVKLEARQLTNNMCKRHALAALHACLPSLVHTRHAALGLDALVALIPMRHSTYNLVKCELVDLLASVDFKAVSYVEQLLPGDAVLVALSKRQSAYAGYYSMRRQRQQETMSKEKSATDEPEDDVDDNPTRFSDKERSKVKIFQVVHLIFY